MTLQTLRIGRREYVLIARRDFERLSAEASRQREDDYWTKAALAAEADARRRRQKPIPFEQVERELDARRSGRPSPRRRR